MGANDFDKFIRWFLIDHLDALNFDKKVEKKRTIRLGRHKSGVCEFIQSAQIEVPVLYHAHFLPRLESFCKHNGFTLMGVYTSKIMETWCKVYIIAKPSPMLW